MARTHGTRSAYNAGCRCDDCREATRLSRARQRAGQQWEPSGFVPDTGGEGIAPARRSGMGLALAGVAALGTGGYALWHGWTAQPTDGDDPDAHARSRRRRYLLAGTALVLTGLVLLAWARSAEAT